MGLHQGGVDITENFHKAASLRDEFILRSKLPSISGEAPALMNEKEVADGKSKDGKSKKSVVMHYIVAFVTLFQVWFIISTWKASQLNFLCYKAWDSWNYSYSSKFIKFSDCGNKDM